MRTEFTIPSNGAGQLHCCRWTPEGQPKAVLQIVHGIAEYIERYDEFASYLNGLGYLVVAEDHMGHGGTVGDQGVHSSIHRSHNLVGLNGTLGEHIRLALEVSIIIQNFQGTQEIVG